MWTLCSEWGQAYVDFMQWVGSSICGPYAMGVVKHMWTLKKPKLCFSHIETSSNGDSVSDMVVNTRHLHSLV